MTISIADLKTPADFTANLTVAHMENLRDNLIAALGRADIEVTLDAYDGGDVPDDVAENISDRLIHVRIGYVNRDPDEPTDKGVWEIILTVPHEDNMYDDWTNSYSLVVSDIDDEMLEHVTVENGNPRMYETFVDRLNYWLPEL